jgi:hypothetical protein
VQGSGGGFLGYVTAWLRRQLAGDPAAGAAFRGARPELLTDPARRNQAAKNQSSGPRPAVSRPPEHGTAVRRGGPHPVLVLDAQGLVRDERVHRRLRDRAVVMSRSACAAALAARLPPACRPPAGVWPGTVPGILTS